MRDQQQSQQSQRDPTEQLQQSTMNQGQEAIEQAIDLQRNVARMTLSAMKWQETAQRQGLEITKSMMQGFPGQGFTQSMVESYLQGLEAVVPEMERAMEKGMRAATQSQSDQRHQMGGQGMGSQQQTGQQFGSQQRMGGQGIESRQGTQQFTGQTSGQEMGGQQMGGRYQSSQQTGQYSQQPTQQYPQTGEWVSQAGSYGGEASGSIDQQRSQQPGTGDQFGRQQQSQPRHYETQSQQQPQPQSQSQRTEMDSQHGIEQPTRGREQEHRNRGREFGETSQHQTGQGRLREQYSQRIDTDRRASDRGRQRQPIAQGQQRGGGSASEEIESSEQELERDEDEMPQDDMEVSAERGRDDTDEEDEDDEQAE